MISTYDWTGISCVEALFSAKKCHEKVGGSTKMLELLGKGEVNTNEWVQDVVKEDTKDL